MSNRGRGGGGLRRGRGRGHHHSDRQQNNNPIRRDEFLPEHREKTLYVGNLDRRCTEYHLIKLFGKYGEIDRVNYLWHHSGELRGAPRGYAFVEMKTRGEALEAQAKTDKVELGGRNIIVRFAEERDSSEINIAFSSLDDRRKAELESKDPAPRAASISTSDKIRAIEEKLKRMDSESGVEKPSKQSKTSSSSSSSSSSSKVSKPKRPRPVPY